MNFDSTNTFHFSKIRHGKFEQFYYISDVCIYLVGFFYIHVCWLYWPTTFSVLWISYLVYWNFIQHYDHKKIYQHKLFTWSYAYFFSLDRYTISSKIICLADGHAQYFSMCSIWYCSWLWVFTKSLVTSRTKLYKDFIYNVYSTNNLKTVKLFWMSKIWEIYFMFPINNE